MQAVLLAGGRGSRLHPLTYRLPKPMVPIFDRPVIEHTLRLLKRHGVDHVVLTLGYRANDIIRYFGTGAAWDMTIQYVIEETPLGTAGGLRALKPLIDSTFLVLSGDGITDFNLSSALAVHHARRAEATMLLYRVPDIDARSEFGIVETGASGRITRFLEKPKPYETFSENVNTGIYLLEPSILDRLPESGSYDFSRQLFPALLEEGAEFYGHSSSGYWCDIGNLKQYKQVHQDALMGKIRLDLGADGAQQIEPGIWIGSEARIHSTARFDGPCFVGRQATVMPGARIGGCAVIGHTSQIDSHAIVSASVIGANSHVGKGAVVRNCILAENHAVEQQSRHLHSVMTPFDAPMPICQTTGRAIIAHAPHALAV